MPNCNELLILEDSDTDRELILRNFFQKGSHPIVHEKDSAEDALEFLKNRSDNYNGIILFDIGLPYQSGLDFVRQLKKIDKLKSVPVIAFTSSEDDREVDEAYRIGVNSFVKKPKDYDQFRQVVGQIGKYWSSLNTPPM